MNTNKEHTGGCFCGQIRYRVLGEPLWSSNCHCTNCRRFSGAAFSSEVFFEKSNFEWLQGDLTRFPSSDWGKRGFCSRCGSHLAYEDERLPDYIGVNIGSLDEPNDFPPQVHIWTSSKLQWIQLNDGLTEYPQDPPMEVEA
jgi:hypothetical protein